MVSGSHFGLQPPLNENPERYTFSMIVLRFFLVISGSRTGCSCYRILWFQGLVVESPAGKMLL